MQVKASPAQVLREALKDQHSNETFEKALGRIVRTHQGTFADYMNLIGLVRQRAERDKTSLVKAANAMASEE